MSRDFLLEQYIQNHIDSEDEVLKELDRETHLKVLQPRMLSGHLQGKILEMLSRMIRPKMILELGTFTGYSAICLARGLAPEGMLHTVESNDELEWLARKYIARAGLQDSIIQHTGPACELIGRLSGPFDLVFMDADKREYPLYYDLVFDKIPVGGYLLADNTLWAGKVVEETDLRDKQTLGILDFNSRVKDDPRVSRVILPIRDGLTIVRKISD